MCYKPERLYLKASRIGFQNKLLFPPQYVPRTQHFPQVLFIQCSSSHSASKRVLFLFPKLPQIYLLRLLPLNPPAGSQNLHPREIGPARALPISRRVGRRRARSAEGAGGGGSDTECDWDPCDDELSDCASNGEWEMVPSGNLTEPMGPSSVRADFPSELLCRASSRATLRQALPSSLHSKRWQLLYAYAPPAPESSRNVGLTMVQRTKGLQTLKRGGTTPRTATRGAPAWHGLDTCRASIGPRVDC